MKKLLEDLSGSCLAFVWITLGIMACLCEAAFVIAVLNN